jgi:REP element-mobilizing transposase RayT
MDDYESLSHSRWECKYYVVFIPKYRRKTLYVELRRHLGDVFRKLAEQKEQVANPSRGRVSDPDSRFERLTT